MKKCLMMFTLLLLTLVVAILMERRQENPIMEKLALGEKISEDIAFEQIRPDQNEEIEERVTK